MAVNAATPNRSLREQSPTCTCISSGLHRHLSLSDGHNLFFFFSFCFSFCLIGGLLLSVSLLYMIFLLGLIVLFCLSTSRLGNPCISPDTRGESSFISLFVPRVDQRFQSSGRLSFCHLHRAEGRQIHRQIHDTTDSTRNTMRLVN